MATQTRASWIFGGLFVAFILGVFAFGPEALPGYKQQLLAYICALLAGLFALFFTGALLLNAELPLAGKWTVQGGAGFGLFLIVLFWWQSPAALIHKEPDAAPARTVITSPKAPPVEKAAVSPVEKPKAPAVPETKIPAPIVMTTATETYSSDDIASGACEGYGGWGTVCSAAKPDGWTISYQNFALSGDRGCGAYSHCEPVGTITDTKACYRFQTQGHNEECGHSGNTGIHYSKGVLTVIWKHPT